MSIKVFIACLAGLACLLGGLPEAKAARFSGQYLIEVCSSDKDGKELVPGGHIACQAYIAGLLDYHNLIRSMGTSPSVNFCVPEQIDMYSLQNKVVEYLRENQKEHAGFVASPGVALALFSSFPCEN